VSQKFDTAVGGDARSRFNRAVMGVSNLLKTLDNRINPARSPLNHAFPLTNSSEMPPKRVSRVCSRRQHAFHWLERFCG